MRRTPSPPPRPAFTVTVLLVSISVIAILISLLAPALRAVKVSAAEAQSLSRIRNVGMVLELATEAAGGDYPFAPPDTWLDATPDGRSHLGTFRTGDPWALRYAWPTLVHDVAPWREHYETWLSPGTEHDPEAPWRRPSGQTLWPSFEYANAFIADPRLWSETIPEEELDPAKIVTAQRRSTLRSPSAKALSFDADRTYLLPQDRVRAPRAILTADGAAALRRDDDARPPVPNPLRSGEPWLYHDTRDGLAGRDF